MYILNDFLSTFICPLLKNLRKRVKLIGYYLDNENQFSKVIFETKSNIVINLFSDALITAVVLCGQSPGKSAGG